MDALPRLILASTSPYRRELLARLRLPFETMAPGVDETPLPNEAPHELALRLARTKALAIARQHPGAIVIGSDQVALCEGEVLGKPGDFEHAFAQLRRMAGKEVRFHSALAVCRWPANAGLASAGGGGAAETADIEARDVVTRCRLRQLSDAAITGYLRAEEPYDTAGSAKAEGLGIALMEQIQSDDPTALIGLPLIELTRMLARFGLDPLGAAAGAGERGVQ